MNYCRKTELFLKDESETEIIHIQDIKNDETEKSETIIDLNLMKIVEDIVNRILEKKFPNKRIKSGPLNMPVISKFALKPLVNKVKS